MEKKIVGILVCMLLMTTVGLPSITGERSQKNDMPQLNEHRPAPLDTNWWPMFGHDLSHSRYSTSLGPDTNNSLWNYTTGDRVYSSPAVADGKIYIGSMDQKVYCLNASNGTKVWNYTTGGYVRSSPAVADGKVYVGSNDNKVYCLNAATGGLVWNYTTGFPVVSSPAVANGKVYVGSGGMVYCLNAATGGFVWSFSTFASVESSPAVADGKVYVGSDDGSVYCLNATTGNWVWDSLAHGYVVSSPAVANGKVYIGSYDYNVYCLDATTGVPVWCSTTFSTVESSPAVANGKVYVGSDDYRVYCLNASNGTKVWNYTTGGYVISSPAVADGKVYVGSCDGKVYCLNAATGGLVWNYTTGFPVVSSPAVADRKVYVGSYTDDKVYCFGLNNIPPIFGTPSPVNGSTNQSLSFTWSIPINDPEGDTFAWSIQCSNGQTASGSGTLNGTKSLLLSGLSYLTTYTIWVNATDPLGSGLFTRQWYIFTARAANWSELQKLFASDGAANDGFGSAVSVSDDTALIGAYGDDDKGVDSGSAYVFIRTGRTWVFQQKLNASDGQAGDNFGRSVVLDGDTALIGAPGDDDVATDAGAAYVFTRSGTTWTQQQKIHADDSLANESFGWSVSLSGQNALIGAPNDDDKGIDAGSAYVFTWNGYTWTQHPELLDINGGAAGDHFGYSVSISGGTALIGAYMKDYYLTPDCGAVIVFYLIGDAFLMGPRLMANDYEANDRFGCSVSLSGDTALVGAYGNDDNGINSGSAYVFTRSNGAWIQSPKLLASDGAAGDLFGTAVSLSGNTVLIGAYGDESYRGSAYVLSRSGTTWDYQKKLVASDGVASDYFGLSVSLSGGNALIGAPGDDSSQGSAYAFIKGSQPPYMPRGPSPSDGATEVNIYHNLYCTGGDPDVGDTVTYDVYFGTTNPPPKVVSNQSSTTYSPGTMLYTTTYYWRICAWDNTHTSTVGPLWQFTTSINHPPYISDLVPANNSVDMSLNTQLSWRGGDLDNNPVTYDVYFGSTNPPPKMVSNQSALLLNHYNPGVLSSNTVYYWRIAAWDNFGAWTSGPLYQFTTKTYDWLQQQRLIASDGALNAYFGYSVSLDGDYALIGAQGANTAYIFTRSGTGWIQQAQLNGSSTGGKFGYSVSLNGDYAIIGAYQARIHNNNNAGTAYIFKRSGTSWAQQAQLNASNGAANDWFGYSVSISGSYAIIGAQGRTTNTGTAYIFTRSGSSWTQQAELNASNHAGSSYFGCSVSINGNDAIIGAYGRAANKGTAYIFTFSGTTWIQQSELNASNGNNNDQFGWSVAINAGCTVIGAYHATIGGHSQAGTAYIFRHSGISWIQEKQINASNPAVNNYFSYSVSINGEYAIIGAYGANIGGAGAGTAYIFKNSGQGWIQQKQLNASRPNGNDNFGWAVSIFGDIALVGVPYNDTIAGRDAGCAYFFEVPNSAPYDPRNPDPADEATAVDITTDLSWTGGDPNLGDTVTYDVYFGTTASPSKIASNQTMTSYTLPTLSYSTQYYWKIISWDNHGASTQGPLWSFTTEPAPVYTLTITIDPAGSGTVIKNPDQHNYIYGQTVHLTANPNYGTAFDHWGGDITGTDNPTTITIDHNTTVTAYFRLLQSPQANFTYTPSNPTTMTIISFTDTSTDSDGYITSWFWDFGDGSTSTQQNPTHQYNNPQTYQVQLTVMDNTNLTNTVTKPVIVNGVPDLCIVSLTATSTPPGITITAKIKNKGNADITTPFQTTLYGAYMWTNTPYQYPLFTQTIPSLAAGANTTVTHAFFSLPKYYYYAVWADSSHVITESNEFNNGMYITYIRPGPTSVTSASQQ